MVMTSIPLSCRELVAEFGAYAAALAHVYMACARVTALRGDSPACVRW